MGHGIVVGVDGSARSRAAVDWAVGEALLSRRPLRLVHVAPAPGEDVPATWPDLLGRTPGRWAEQLTELHPELRVEGAGRTGAVVPTLRSLAAGADLTVLGTRGAGGFAGLAVGSVAHDVAASTAGPVVLVPDGVARPWGVRRYHRVTVGVDARNPAGAAVAFAFEAAERRRARLRAVHAWRFPSPGAEGMPYAVPEEDWGAWEDQESQLLSDALRPWREKHPSVDVQPDVRLKTPAAALVEASAAAGLLVVGRRGTALGAVLYAVLTHTACPVAVVPS